jgi:chemotaxis protein methyltransferase CheR
MPLGQKHARCWPPGWREVVGTNVTIKNTDFIYVCDMVRKHSAIVLDSGKEYLVESRLNPLARQEGFSSLQHMVDCLRSTPSGDLHRKVVEAMTTNETSFFREMKMFDMFRKTILPKLLAQRARERSLTLWCAASSTGQEPYSFAMLLREHLPALDGWNITFIASDISRDMLARAREGRFNQLEVNRGLPAHLLVKYFTKQGATWEISPEIRRMVEFREINLIQAWPFLPRLDFISMRNVLIYLDFETKKSILSRIPSVLDTEGYLVLGGAETTTNIDDGFEAVPLDGATCFRLRKRFPSAARAGVPIVGQVY